MGVEKAGNPRRGDERLHWDPGWSCAGLALSHRPPPAPSSSRLAPSHRLLRQPGSRWPPLSTALSCCDLTAIKCQIKVMGRRCRSAEARGTQWIIVMERMMSWLLPLLFLYVYLIYIYIDILYFISVSAWNDLTCVIPLLCFKICFI